MYFVKITNSHNSKNRLQEYVSKQLKQLDYSSVEDPEQFKQHIIRLVYKANLRFPRCRPLAAYLHKAHLNNDLRAGLSEVIQFSLYEQRGTFESVADKPPLLPNEGLQTAMFTN